MNCPECARLKKAFFEISRLCLKLGATIQPPGGDPENQQEMAAATKNWERARKQYLEHRASHEHKGAS